MGNSIQMNEYWTSNQIPNFSLSGNCLYVIQNNHGMWVPKKCPITNMKFNRLINLTPIYGNSKYSGYCIPYYDIKHKVFYHAKYNKIKGYWVGDEEFMDLKELKGQVSSERFKFIKSIYNIIE